MTDLANPSPPPGGNPSPPAVQGPVAEARIPVSADARMRAGARQDKPEPGETGAATPAVPEIPRIEWVSTIGAPLVVALCASLTWYGGYEFAVLCGWPPPLAWMMPLITDVYAGVALWIWLGLRWTSTPTKHFAAVSAGFSVAESVALQVGFHTFQHGKVKHIPPVGVVIAVSVLAPIMLALTAHLVARINGDRGQLVRAGQDAATRAADAERADAARLAADQAATARAAAEAAAAARQAEADRAATERADAERAAAAQRAATARAAAERAAAGKPRMGQDGDVAHGPDTAGGPRPGDVAHGPSGQMAHGPDDMDHDADGPDDDPGDTRPPGVLPPEDQPDEPEMPGDVFAKARNVYRQSCRDGKAIADRPLGAQFGHSRNWGATRIKEVKQGVHLAAASGQ